MWGDEFPVWVRANATEEAQKGLEGWDEGVDEAVTEHVDLEATELNILQSVLVNVGECDLVLALFKDSFNVVEFSVSNEEPVLAEEGLGLLSIDGHGNILCIARVIIVDVIFEGDLLEA